MDYKNMKLYLTRDKHRVIDTTLMLTNEKPVLSQGGENWLHTWESDLMSLPDEWFPEVTFENSPVEVKLVLNDNKTKIRDEIFELARQMYYGDMLACEGANSANTTDVEVGQRMHSEAHVKIIERLQDYDSFSDNLLCDLNFDDYNLTIKIKNEEI